MYARRNVDPELEKLRSQIDGPPNLDTVTLNILKSTSKIHAAYLFDIIGKSMLQRLCLLLSSTATGKIYDGWQEFAAHLGLTIEQIRCIDYDFKGLQDPTYYVLLAYVQFPDATLDKILHVLQKINRFDIINQIKDYVNEVVTAIFKDKTTNDSVIIKPENIPRVPLVLSPITIVKDSEKRNDHAPERNLEENIETSSTKTTQKYGCIVMLTFADDGLTTAQYIAKIFRSQQPRIGVVILQEQEKYVYSRAEEFIDDCFNQVNYIIPILTRGYIEKISNPTKLNVEVQNRLDVKYLNYVYSLLRYEYVKNRCCNNRVRCIVPDKEVYTVARSNLHPTLQAWFRESDINSFVDYILLQKF